MSLIFLRRCFSRDRCKAYSSIFLDCAYYWCIRFRFCAIDHVFLKTLFVSTLLNSLFFGPARSGVERTGFVLSSSILMQCLAGLMRRSFPFYVNRNLNNIFMNSLWYALHLSDTCISIRQFSAECIKSSF